MKRDKFTVYRWMVAAIRNLPAVEFKEAMMAIFNYALDGVTSERVSGTAQSVFMLCKPQIDKNNKKYMNGLAGGRPKKDVKE